MAIVIVAVEAAARTGAQIIIIAADTIQRGPGTTTTILAIRHRGTMTMGSAVDDRGALSGPMTTATGTCIAEEAVEWTIGSERVTRYVASPFLFSHTYWPTIIVIKQLKCNGYGSVDDKSISDLFIRANREDAHDCFDLYTETMGAIA